jgi:hypothetical protein
MSACSCVIGLIFACLCVCHWCAVLGVVHARVGRFGVIHTVYPAPYTTVRPRWKTGELSKPLNVDRGRRQVIGGPGWPARVELEPSSKCRRVPGPVMFSLACCTFLFTDTRAATCCHLLASCRRQATQRAKGMRLRIQLGKFKRLPQRATTCWTQRLVHFHFGATTCWTQRLVHFHFGH